MNDTDDTTELEIRLQNLEAKLDQVVMPRVQAFEQMQSEIETLHGKIGRQTDRIEALEGRLNAILGVADEVQSSHDKRVQDTRHILLKQADARDGKASMYWREIADALTHHGHEDLERTQIVRVMDDVAYTDGFDVGRGKRDVARTDDRSDVREVQVLQCELDRVPGVDPANNVFRGNREGVPPHADDTTEHTNDVTQHD